MKIATQDSRAFVLQKISRQQVAEKSIHIEAGYGPTQIDSIADAFRRTPGRDGLEIANYASQAARQLERRASREHWGGLATQFAAAMTAGVGLLNHTFSLVLVGAGAFAAGQLLLGKGQRDLGAADGMTMLGDRTYRAATHC